MRRARGTANVFAKNDRRRAEAEGVGYGKHLAVNSVFELNERLERLMP